MGDHRPSFLASRRRKQPPTLFLRSKKISVENLYFDLDESIWENGLASLTEVERGVLERVREALPIVADVSRSDIFLFFPDGERFCVAIHARSHAMATLYDMPQTGRYFRREERPWMWQAVTKGAYDSHILREIPDVRTEVQQQMWPVLGDSGQQDDEGRGPRRSSWGHEEEGSLGGVATTTTSGGPPGSPCSLRAAVMGRLRRVVERRLSATGRASQAPLEDG